MNDLEKSELVISRILSLLMEWGIQESRLEFSELELDATEFGSFFWPCIEWLVAEGVVRTETHHRTLGSVHSGEVLNPVLTSYGLKLLGQRLSVGQEQEQLADRVKQVSKSGTNYSGIGDLVGGILGGFTKSISS